MYKKLIRELIDVDERIAIDVSMGRELDFSAEGGDETTLDDRSAFLQKP